MYKFDREAYDRRMEWYRDARFGMFIHWGLYAIPARGEWVRSTEQIPKEDYMKYFEEFNPVDFEPRKWAKAAKEAGMKYVVLTAKHHDGFCLFDSQYTNFKSTNTKCGRDLVAEYVDAVRAEGLKVGLSFSLLDWFHDDFPHYGDRNHPMRNNPAYKNDDRDFDRYLTYMHNQVREICTNYGKLDVLWFDFSYDTLRGEAWKATELINMVRKLQPDVIIDNRLEVSGEGYGSLAAGNPTILVILFASFNCSAYDSISRSWLDVCELSLITASNERRSKCSRARLRSCVSESSPNKRRQRRRRETQGSPRHARIPRQHG